MNTEGKSTKLLTVPEGTVDAEQALEGAVIQDASLLVPLDEAMLQAMLELADLMHSESAGRPEREPMRCYECRGTTDERCSYCLSPVCSKHGGQVKLWFARQHVMVCTPCQERLREAAREEQDLLLV